MLEGQWIGVYDNRASLVLDLDAAPGGYAGTLCAWLHDASEPSLYARLNLSRPSGERYTSDACDLIPINQDGSSLSAAQMETLNSKGSILPTKITFQIDSQQNSISFSWESPYTNGCSPLHRADMKSASTLTPSKCSTWKKFKSFMSTIERRRYVFRGHESNKWKLRTTFHRMDRYDIERYQIDDIRDLTKIFSFSAGYIFDQKDPVEHAALIHLAQHHGYPTPFLDWTWSPYVAAYFAYRRLSHDTKFSKKKVRILKLDTFGLNRTIRRHTSMFPSPLGVSIIDPIIFSNTRSIPQQAISLYSNVDDIETYLNTIEKSHGSNLLEAFDLPVYARPEVIRDLEMMGITAGSLFPGLDGACEALKERNFY